MTFVRPIAPITPDEDFDTDRVLQACVVGITGLDGTLVRVRFAKTPFAEPTTEKTWAAIGVLSTNTLGAPSTNPSASDPANEVIMQVQETLQVVASFYGPGNKSIAGVFRDGLSIPQNRETLAAAGFGVHSIGEVISLPELVGKEYRARVDVHVTFLRQIDRRYASSTFAQEGDVSFIRQ